MKTFIKTYNSAEDIEKDLAEINNSGKKIIVLKNGFQGEKDVLFYGKDSLSNMFVTDKNNPSESSITGVQFPIGIQGSNAISVYYGENNDQAINSGDYISSAYDGTFPEGSAKKHFDANLKAILDI